MASGFDWLKNNRKEATEHLHRHLMQMLRKEHYEREADFLIRSLHWAGFGEDVGKLESCQRGKCCGYIYCGTCRVRLAENLYGRFLGHFDEIDGGKGDWRERLRWVTILDGLVRADTDEVRSAVKAARGGYRNLNRRWNRSWAQGVIELELVDMQKALNRRVAEGESRKRDVLRNFVDGNGSLAWEDKRKEQRSDWILVHSHFLMDSGDHDWEEIKNDMKSRWDGSYRVRADRLHGDKELEGSARKLSNYSFKNRMKFNYSFGNYRWEPEAENEDNFSMAELSNLFLIYKDLMGANNTGLLLGWSAKG